VIAAFELSIGASIIAAVINSIFGIMVAWTLSRYEFPGKGLLDALVDLPFALPTSVAGITLTSIYAQTVSSAASSCRSESRSRSRRWV